MNCVHVNGLKRASQLTVSDVSYMDYHPDLYDSERATVWRLVKKTLSRIPIKAISIDERVALLRRSAEGASNNQLAIEFGYPEELINLHLFFERRRLRTPELQEFYDAYWS